MKQKGEGSQFTKSWALLPDCGQVSEEAGKKREGGAHLGPSQLAQAKAGTLLDN